ncbi:hypothetical protein GY45DRAFT_1124981 [Cubamyces sp. BRFM 1775]|nr:hypothetical protein GY45DRAFT_1124981 [Cubamyces sp. BRFM 1775]
MVSLTLFPPEPVNTPFSSITFDTLPYDLLEQIFRNACTDGGRTGASLSLVSKRIRALSRPFRFYSVSLLTGIRWQLLRFRYALTSARVEAAKADDDLPLPRVRHLCILLTGFGAGPIACFASSPLDRAARAREGLPTFDGDDDRTPEELFDICLQARAAYQVELRILFSRIGTADLESLCAFQHEVRVADDILEAIPCPDGFARLREFWFSTPEPPPFVCNAPNRRLEPLYPALRRVHMGAKQQAAINFKWWAINAPRVRELRISTVGPPGGIPEFLPSLLFILSRASHPAREPQLWTELKCVQFMYRANFSRHDTAAEHAAHDTLVERVRESFEELYPLVEFSPDYRFQDVDAESLGIRYGSCPLDRENPEEFEGEVMRWDWRLRMTGHEGVYTPHHWKPSPPPLMRRLQRVLTSTQFFAWYIAVCVLLLSYSLKMCFTPPRS